MAAMTPSEEELRALLVDAGVERKSGGELDKADPTTGRRNRPPGWASSSTAPVAADLALGRPDPG